MNFTNISYFLAIVEEGSISAASRKLYISQQSLSELLKKLEAEVGAPLFKRSPLRLTTEGECFYEGGKRLMSIYTDMMSDIKVLSEKRHSKITIGIPTCCTPPYLMDFLLYFQSNFPEYEVSIVKRQHVDIAHNISGVDLYLSYLPLSPNLENHILLDHDPICAMFQRSLAESVFGERWEAVEEQLLRTQDLSLLKEMPFTFLRDRYGNLTEDLQNIFREYRMAPLAGFDSENADLNGQASYNGLACFLNTESYINRSFYNNPALDTSELLSYPIRVTSFETKMAISHEKGRRLHAAELCFIKKARQFIQNATKDNSTGSFSV